MTGLEGHLVTVHRVAPLPPVDGELRHYDDRGATVWVQPWGTRGMAKFLPTHTILEIESRGERPR